MVSVLQHWIIHGNTDPDTCAQCVVNADLDEVREETERQKVIWRETLDWLAER